MGRQWLRERRLSTRLDRAPTRGATTLEPLSVSIGVARVPVPEFPIRHVNRPIVSPRRPTSGKQIEVKRTWVFESQAPVLQRESRTIVRVRIQPVAHEAV